MWLVYNVSYPHLTLRGPSLFEHSRSIRKRQTDVLWEETEDPPVENTAVL